MELIQFSELEHKLKNLLGEHAALKKRNLALEAEVKNKIAELEGVSNKLKEFKEERDSVRTKVDSLLEMIKSEPWGRTFRF